MTEEVYRAPWHYTHRQGGLFHPPAENRTVLGRPGPQTAAPSLPAGRISIGGFGTGRQFACESKPVEEQADFLPSGWRNCSAPWVGKDSRSSTSARCWKYARGQGYNNTRFYIDDGVSGTTFRRWVFQQMISDIQSGRSGASLRICRGLGGTTLVGMYTEGSFSGERHPFHCGERWRGQRKGGK